MIRIFWLLFFVVSSITTKAHNPLSAKFDVSIKGEYAILTANLSQAGVHQALIKRYATTNFDSLSAVDYKKILVQYIKENTHLVADGSKLSLGEGGVRLGNHQTDLKFVIEQLPSNLKSMEVRLNCFQENENHQTIFFFHFENFYLVNIFSTDLFSYSRGY